MRREVLPPRSFRLERAATAAATLALVACAVEPEPALYVTPVGPAGWDAQVQEAADLWNEAAGCELVRLGEEAFTVERIALWTEGETVRGYYDENGIGVRANPYEIERATLVHELGHALGLQHSLEPDSVMREPVGARYVPTEADAAAVRPGC